MLPQIKLNTKNEAKIFPEIEYKLQLKFSPKPNLYT